MSNQDKKREVKQAINNDLYKLVDEIETEENFTSDYDTNELADILNDYMTDVQPDLTSDLLEGPLDDIKIEHQTELNLAVDESQLIKEYDKHLTHLGDTTLNEFREADKEMFAELEEAKRIPDDDLDQAILMLEERTKELSEELKNKTHDTLADDVEMDESIELTNTIISPSTFNLDEEDIIEDDEYYQEEDSQDTVELILDNEPLKDQTQTQQLSTNDDTVDLINQLTSSSNEDTKDLSHDLSTVELSEFASELERTAEEFREVEEDNSRKKLTPFDYVLIILIIVCALAAVYLYLNR